MPSISSTRRTVDDIFKDYNSRRTGIVRALTIDVDEFYALYDPEKDNLCLYGHPDGSWEVMLPAEEVPPELPEPLFGITTSHSTPASLVAPSSVPVTRATTMMSRRSSSYMKPPAETTTAETLDPHIDAGSSSSSTAPHPPHDTLILKYSHSTTSSTSTAPLLSPLTPTALCRRTFFTSTVAISNMPPRFG